MKDKEINGAIMIGIKTFEKQGRCFQKYKIGRVQHLYKHQIRKAIKAIKKIRNR